MTGVGPSEVGVVQRYENLPTRVVMALRAHGGVAPNEDNDFSALDNLAAPDCQSPLNTSASHLAEGYIHGFELVLQTVRQTRGTSSDQACRNDVALFVCASSKRLGLC